MCEKCGSLLACLAAPLADDTATTALAGTREAQEAPVRMATASGNAAVDALISGPAWGGPVRFGFPQSAGAYGGGSSEALTGFLPVSSAQQAVARAALLGTASGETALLHAFPVTGFTLLQVSEAAASQAEIRFAQSSQPPTAWAYSPGSSDKAGDVWFGDRYDYRHPALGDYAYESLLHELGHALGLKHPHEATGITGQAMETAWDNSEFTVMSYRSHSGGTLGQLTAGPWDLPQTYMMLDIAALQTLYGADYGLRDGDTRYSWNPATGEMSIDGAAQGRPGANRVFMTVWDGGGNDTYDLSGYAGGVVVDLAPGGASITSEAQRAWLDQEHGIRASGTVYNALLHEGDTRSLIENAIGGAGNDRISGNQAANTLRGAAGDDHLLGLAGADRLFGEAGDDILEGGAGNDLLDGGAGFDIGVFDAAFLPGGAREAAVSAIPGGWTVAISAVSGGRRGTVETDTALALEELRFTDGSIRLDGDALLDPVWYARHYADVYRAGIGAASHYATHGWQEGRDPSAGFSTAAYLSAHPGVGDPLAHWRALGWQAGLDARADFDTGTYLARNADVAAAGIDPLAHWLAHGQAEGRAATPAIGATVRDGFDAEYYLLANPDVGRAGADPGAHYAAHGWHEGRDPDGWFDTAGYLARYADVAAAGIEPLAHYIQFGWREGRDPSALFDTRGYLAANPDVAAAGINPLQHFLTAGALEGRAAAGDGVWA